MVRDGFFAGAGYALRADHPATRQSAKARLTQDRQCLTAFISIPSVS